MPCRNGAKNGDCAPPQWVFGPQAASQGGTTAAAATACEVVAQAHDTAGTHQDRIKVQAEVQRRMGEVQGKGSCEQGGPCEGEAQECRALWRSETQER